MKLSNALPQDLTPYRMIESIRGIVRSALRELERQSDEYHHSEFGIDGYIKALGRFNGISVDGENRIQMDENYVLLDGDLPFWCFRSDQGVVILYADGVIEVGNVVFDVALGNEIVALLNKIYSVNC